MTNDKASYSSPSFIGAKALPQVVLTSCLMIAAQLCSFFSMTNGKCEMINGK